MQIMQSFMKLAAVLILRLLILQNERGVMSGARVILVMQNANMASTLMTHQHSAPVLGGGYVLLRSSKPIATEANVDTTMTCYGPQVPPSSTSQPPRNAWACCYDRTKFSTCGIVGPADTVWAIFTQVKLRHLRAPAKRR